jgi:hypothetical protein
VDGHKLQVEFFYGGEVALQKLTLFQEVLEARDDLLIESTDNLTLSFLVFRPVLSKRLCRPLHNVSGIGDVLLTILLSVLKRHIIQNS